MARNESTADFAPISGVNDALARLLAEHVLDVTYHYLDGVIQWISASASRVLGWDPGVLIGRKLAELAHPDHRSTSELLSQELLRSGQARGELPVRRGDGSWCWMDVVEVAIPQAEGDPLVVGWARDISERRAQDQELNRLRQRSEALAALASDVVLEVDSTCHCVWISQASAALLGYTPEELVGANLREQLVHPDDWPIADRYRNLLVSTSLQPTAEDQPVLRLRQRNGEELSLLVRAAPLFDSNGVLRGFLASLRSVKPLIAQLQDVEQRRSRLAAQLDSQLDIHAVLEAVHNPDGTIIDSLFREANLAVCQDTGRSREQLIGSSLMEVLPGHGPSGLLQLYADVVTSGEPLLIDDFPFPDPVEPLERRYDIRAVKLGDGLSACLRNVTERHRMVQHLAASERLNRELARTDPLTGLLNRRGLDEEGAALVAAAAATGTPLALMVIDLDRFKTINDSLGHAVGDRLLVHVAGLLRQLCPNQLVARFGGDEFVVVVRDAADPNQLISLADQLRRSIDRVHGIGEHQLVTSPSIGISLYPNDASDLAGLIQMADTAMYSAKAQGRNAWLFFTSSMSLAAKERLSLESDLRQALKQEQLALAFQPLWHWQPEGMVLAGFETLLRWHHPQLGVVPPSQFVPVAEESGLVNAIGAWVLQQGCLELRRWPKAARHLRLAVNLSGVQFRQADLVDQVQRALAVSGADGHQLELEITEGVLMDDAERTRNVLTALKSLEVQLAIDDFGTGYSSLNYLRAFPIDRIKIDRSFVEHCADNTSSAAIVKAVLSLAHALGKDTIAEGVETEAQLEFLLAQGCRDFQGYLLSKPLEQRQMAAFIANPTRAAQG